MDTRLLMVGDTALTVEFQGATGPAGAARVRALKTVIDDAARDAGKNAPLEGLIDSIAAFRTLTLCLDPLRADIPALRAWLKATLQDLPEGESAAGTAWCLPACYEGKLAEDLDDIARQAGLRPQDVIDLHSGQTYDVLAIGFLPGFPFMGPLPEPLHFPRRKSPRLRVPPGAVGIAGGNTAIYPWESPGGWHLIARCPVPLFDTNYAASGRASPSLLTPGDKVRFTPVSTREFETLRKDLAHGAQPLERFAESDTDFAEVSTEATENKGADHGEA